MNLGGGGGDVFPQICFHIESPYNSWKILVILNSHEKSLGGPDSLKICMLA